MIRIRSLFGDETLIKRTIDYYDAGTGPIYLADGQDSPVETKTLFNRSNDFIFDRFNQNIETRA